MPSLRWKNLFNALFLAGVMAYLLVAISGNQWIGVPVLMLTGWLFYEFRKKIIILKQVFTEELPRGAKRVLGVAKKIYDGNSAKIYSFAIVPIVLLLGWMNFFFFLEILEDKPVAISVIMITICITALAFWICWLVVLRDGKTDEEIGKFVLKLPKFLIWQIPKFLLKVIILTIQKVHSQELAAVSLYSLSGMMYIFVFPPFQLAPTAIFLMAIGCGTFTGLCGIGMHKVFLMTFAQKVFVKARTW